MKTASILCLFGSASIIIAERIYAEANLPIQEIQSGAANELIGEYDFEGNDLEVRAATAYDNAATQAASYPPAVTTFWMQKQIGTTATYVSYTYTQTFAAVPDQYPPPGVGSIGYGTLSQKSKRDAEPTGAGTSFVLEMHTEVATIWLEPVKRVVEIHTVTRINNDTLILNGTTIPAANLSATATAAESISTTKFIFPSQMHPQFVDPPVDE